MYLSLRTPLKYRLVDGYFSTKTAKIKCHEIKVLYGQDTFTFPQEQFLHAI